MYLKFLFLSLISFSILFVSCEADINLHNISDEISLHPNLIIPIGSSSVNLGQIITQNDSSGKFEIGNNSEINYIGLDSSEFKFPNLNILENSHELLKSQYPSPNNTIVINSYSPLPDLSYNDYVNLGINTSKNGDRIDSLKIKSATISVIINVSSDLISIRPSDIVFTISFPNGTIRMLDGTLGSITFSPLGFGLIKNIVIENFMMSTSGYETGIPIGIYVSSKSRAIPVLLSPVSIITSKIKFTQLDYSVVYGNFKSHFNLINTLHQKINFDNDLPNSSLKFVNPQVSISASSNIGTFLNLKIDNIKGLLSTDLNFNPVFANFNGIKSTNIDLKRKPERPGDTINVKLRTLDKDWGGTNQFFESENEIKDMPDMLQYSFSASVDSALNSQSKSPSFITSDSRIKVNIKTIIPLNFAKGSYYEFQDSIPNVFVLISNALNQFPYDNISSAALILNITNGLPVKTNFSFTLNDSTGKVIETTFEKNYIIDAGKVDNNGLVQPGKETKQCVQISVTKDQLTILKRAKKILYKVRIEGDNLNSNIHFTKSNTFDLKIGLFVKGDVNTKLGTKTL